MPKDSEVELVGGALDGYFVFIAGVPPWFMHVPMRLAKYDTDAAEEYSYDQDRQKYYYLRRVRERKDSKHGH